METAVQRLVETAAAIALAGVAACAAPPPPHEGPIGVPPTAAPPSVAREAPAAAASEAPAASSRGAPRDVLPKLPLRKTTPGKIACETSDCDLASEVCCVTRDRDGASTGSCVRKPTDRWPSACCAPGSPCAKGEMTIERRCDETADCAASQQCGEIGPGEGNLASQECDVRQPVEVCLAGSSCKNGNPCQADEAATVGSCDLQIAPAKCGATTCKTGEACCWNADEKRGRCAETCAEGEGRFLCTSPEQCDHSDCDNYPGSMVYDCGGGSFQMGILCRTIKDCPKQISGLGIYPGGPSLKACKHDDAMPPGTRSCIYE